MTEQEEIITRWEKAQIAYDVWFETLPLKHRTGETIYTQLKDVWNHAALDVKKINSLASEQLTAAEARIKELEAILERASWLVGNPGTNISSSTDLACESWQEDYKKLLTK